MMATFSSETSVAFKGTTWYYIPQDITVHVTCLSDMKHVFWSYLLIEYFTGNDAVSTAEVYRPKGVWNRFHDTVPGFI